MRELDRPRIEVDFNEMVAQDVVLLSREDTQRDSAGKVIEMSVGLRVHLYMHDSDENDVPCFLLATGLVEINDAAGWSSHVRWRCRIDKWES